jgi:hypothetical protein
MSGLRWGVKFEDLEYYIDGEGSASAGEMGIILK